MLGTKSNVSKHVLSDKWVLWAHLPHDTDWSLKSYIKIREINSLEEIVLLQGVIPEKMIKNCMLFLMKKDVNPTWEDPRNKEGGCFSFKISNKNVCQGWNKLFINLAANNISNNEKLLSQVTGITISPKKTFCIIKIWMETLEFQSVHLFNNISYLSIHGCLFKRHNYKT